MEYCMGQQNQARHMCRSTIIASSIGCKLNVFGVFLPLKNMQYLMEQMTRTGRMFMDIIGVFVTRAILHWERRMKEFVNSLVHLTLKTRGTAIQLHVLKILLLMALSITG